MGMNKYKRPSDRVQKSRRWPALRMQALRRDGWRCVECGSRGRLEVDHIQAVRDEPDRAFDLDNLQVLCGQCHSRKTRIEMGFDPMHPERQKWRNLLSSVES